MRYKHLFEEETVMKLEFGVKEVVAVGIGSALFVALTQVQIPLGIPNTALQPRAALLAFLSAVFGPIVGAAVGLIGHALGDMFFYGSAWWSWVFPEAVFAIVVGAFANKYGVKEGAFGKKEIILFNVMQVIGNAVAWILAAPILDILIYKEPAQKVFIQGVGAWLGNVLIIAILGTLLTVGYAKVGAKSSSLMKED
jgi:Predicted membrane protein